MGHDLLAGPEFASVLGRERWKMVRVYACCYEGTRSSRASVPCELLRSRCVCAVEQRKTYSRRRMGSRGGASIIDVHPPHRVQPSPSDITTTRSATNFRR